MSASISLLRSKRKAAENLDDSGDESDCSIKDVKKKESIEKDARAIAAINMLTVSMVNQLLEQQGLDPFGKTLASPSLDDGQSWSTPMRTTSRPAITRSIKENTYSKKSRKSVRFTPDSNRNECTPDRSRNFEADNMDLVHTRTVPLSSLKSEPKFTPIRRSKALKAGMLRSLENELDIDSVDNFVCSNESFDSPLPIQNLTGSNAAQGESTDDAPMSPAAEFKTDTDELLTGNKAIEAASSADGDKTSKESTSSLTDEKSLSEGNTSATVSKSEQSVLGDKSEDQSDKNDLLSDTTIKPKWTHHFDPTSPEHMSPFLKTLLEERAERSQGKDLSKSFSSTEDSEDQQKQSILKGVTAFVEVIRADEDRSSGFRWKLKQLGAQVEENFTKKVTHVVFQEGLLSTYRKAKESSVHLVSAFWVMACDESASRVPEDKYPIDEEDKYSTLAPLKKYIRRPKLLSPSLGDGDDEKRLARRLQAIKRRSMKVEGVPSAESDTNDPNVAHSSKTAADNKTPQTSKKPSAGKKSVGAASGGSASLMNAWLTGKKEVDFEKGQGSPPASEAVNIKESTRSPRKRPAEDSPGKLKASSFDSPAKKSSSRSVDSPAKTKPRSPAKMKRGFAAVDSPDEKDRKSELVDSPAKKKPSTKVVGSPAKAKQSSRCNDSSAKEKSSSKSTGSSAKTELSLKPALSRAKSTSSFTRIVDSPAKTKPSSKSFDSPAKTKPSSRSYDSPAKTKPSSRSYDSPAKTKPSSRSYDSPAKTKPSSRSYDSPAKSKTSSRSYDSPAKTKTSSRSYDSSAKTKTSSKLSEPTNSTCVSSPARSKSSSESCNTPKGRKHTSAKSSSLLARCSATSEVSGRVLRSTPKKSHSSTLPSTTEEDETLQIATSTGDNCLPELLSPKEGIRVKRSLNKAFTDHAEIPSTSTISDSASTFACGSKPQNFETPWKKARVELNDQKVLTEEKAKNFSQVTHVKKSASSRSLKTQKSASSRSKIEKKKPSPRTNAAKDKLNDKNQTVMTSHFLPLNVIRNEGKCLKNEASRKVPDEVVPSASSENSKESPRTSQEGDAVLPSVCPPTWIDETESVSPEESHTFSGKVEDRQPPPDVNQELQITSDGCEDPKTSVDSCGEFDLCDEAKKDSVAFDEKAATDIGEDSPRTDALEGLMTSADVTEEPMEDVFEEKDSSSATTNAEDESLKAKDESLKAKDESLKSEDESLKAEDESLKAEDESLKAEDESLKAEDESPKAEDESLKAEDESLKAEDESLKAEDESLKAEDDCQDKLVTDDALVVPVETTSLCEENTATVDSLKELVEATDSFVDTTVSEDAVEGPVTGTLLGEEQTATAGAREESKGAVVCEDKLLTDDAFEVPVKTVDCLNEEQTVTDVPKEESAEAADVVGDISLEACGKPLDELEAQTAIVDAQEESKEVADVCEDNLVNSLEEPVYISDVNQEQQTAADAFEELGKTSDLFQNKRIIDDSEQYTNSSEICEEQTACGLEEPLKTSDLCEEQTASSNFLEGEPITTDVLPDKSSGYLSSVEQDGSCDSFSSQELTSNETCRKKSRKSMKLVNKPCYFRTRRSTRFVSSDTTDE